MLNLKIVRPFVWLHPSNSKSRSFFRHDAITRVKLFNVLFFIGNFSNANYETGVHVLRMQKIHSILTM